MSFSNRSQSDSSAAAIEAEKTLRLIAVLPAPQGIEERVKSRLRAAPRQASGNSGAMAQRFANYGRLGPALRPVYCQRSLPGTGGFG